MKIEYNGPIYRWTFGKWKYIGDTRKTFTTWTDTIDKGKRNIVYKIKEDLNFDPTKVKLDIEDTELVVTLSDLDFDKEKEEKDNEIITYTCPNCSNEISYLNSQREVTCPNCSTHYYIDDAKRLAESKKKKKNMIDDIYLFGNPQDSLAMLNHDLTNYGNYSSSESSGGESVSEEYKGDYENNDIDCKVTFKIIDFNTWKSYVLDKQYKLPYNSEKEFLKQINKDFKEEYPNVDLNIEYTNLKVIDNTCNWFSGSSLKWLNKQLNLINSMKIGTDLIRLVSKILEVPSDIAVEYLYSDDMWFEKDVFEPEEVGRCYFNYYNENNLTPKVKIPYNYEKVGEKLRIDVQRDSSLETGMTIDDDTLSTISGVSAEEFYLGIETGLTNSELGKKYIEEKSDEAKIKFPLVEYADFKKLGESLVEDSIALITRMDGYLQGTLFFDI